jgi:predicted dehydrogenase
MPAMCMRFWPAWAWLKERIEHRTYGRCTGLTLTRIGAAPSWSASFYRDINRSGGALVDLHVHDSDFVLFCFGRPGSVCSVGEINHLTTSYRFGEVDAPAHVVAEGGWLAPGTPFRMRYLAAFEHATADFDLAREPQLLLSHGGKTEPVAISALSGYDVEVRHMLSVTRKDAAALATLDDAVAVTEMLDAERRSLNRHEIIQL